MTMNQHLSPDNAYAVQTDGLSRQFRGKLALDQVNLAIPRGSVFGLVGVNGAGKTTLIKHVMGQLKAQSGSIRVLGCDPTVRPELLMQRIGYLTEEDSLPPWMRVGDMTDLLSALYPTWNTAYASELCDAFELARGTKLSTLSKGQRARVGLLAAIAHEPELLVLDEPSSGLDPLARRDILEAIIRTVNQDGRTVLFSSHLLDEVDRVCDTFALLNGGKLIDTISSEKLRASYVEIICVVEGDPAVDVDESVASGWHLSGSEWSAVALQSRICNLPDSIRVLEQRDISLPRWFEAKSRTSSGSAVLPTETINA